jgi:predicted nucleotidyltransferase
VFNNIKNSIKKYCMLKDDIMIIHEKLLNFAKTKAYSYIMNLDILKIYNNNISVLLVGSTATGLCNENSDVDICLLCKDEIFRTISKDTSWINGRPTEINLEKIQLHYYAISIENIESKLIILDDITLYVYSTAISLNDNSGLFEILKVQISDEKLNVRRKEMAINTLVRRRRALNGVLSELDDYVVRIDVMNEIIKHILKVTALKDNIPFDPRKRPYKTGLSGATGYLISENINRAISLISEASYFKNKESIKLFEKYIDDCILLIK